MATLIELENMIRSMEGHLNADDADLQSSLRVSINHALNRMYEDQPWWWSAVEADVTANSEGNLVLPAETAFVMGVYQNGEPLHPRERQRQKDYGSNITSRGKKTYAHSGYDTTTGFPVLTLHPSGEGDYEIRYAPTATLLVNDTDTIPGPRGVLYYLLWYARFLRLHGDEERQNLRREALAMANDELARLKGRNRKFLTGIPQYLAIG